MYINGNKISKAYYNSQEITSAFFNGEQQLQEALGLQVLRNSKGVYAQKLVIPEYAGALVRVCDKDTPATQVDIFPDVNGEIDETEILAVAVGGIESRLRVVTRYDQTGNGNDLTQSSVNNMPGIQKNWYDDTWVLLYNISRFKGSNTGQGTTNYIENTTVTSDVTNFFAYDISERLHSNEVSNQIAPRLLNRQTELSSGSIFTIYSDYARDLAVAPEPATINRIRMILRNSFKTSTNNSDTASRDTNPNWNAWIADPTNTKFYNGLNRVTSFPSAAARVNTGYREGASFGTSFTSKSVNYISVIDDVKTEAQLIDINNYLLPIYDVPNTQATSLLVIGGDSISSGYDYIFSDEQNYSWASEVLNDPDIRPTTEMTNTAIAGGHINSTSFGGTQFKEILPVAEDKIDQLYDATTYTNGQVFICFAGSNDLGLRNGVPADTVTLHNDLETLCQDRRIKGFKVIVLDIIPRQSFTVAEETERLAFNSLISSNWTSYADAFVQISAEDWLDGGAGFGTYYADGTHPNAAGQTLIANAVIPAVKTQLGL